MYKSNILCIQFFFPSFCLSAINYNLDVLLVCLDFAD
jgi:hypothetical protein